MANDINHYKTPLEPDSLLHYYLNNGLTDKAANKTIVYFDKATNCKLIVVSGYTLEFLLKQSNRY